MPDKSHVREEGFALARGFKDDSHHSRRGSGGGGRGFEAAGHTALTIRRQLALSQDPSQWDGGWYFPPQLT